MERRYLAAILSMAATFAVVSHGLQSKTVDRWLQQKPDLVSEMKCATRTVGAKLLAKINPSLRPEDLDAARVLAWLNLSGADPRPQVRAVAPAEPVQPQPVAVAVQVECPEVLKAQEKALRSAEQMQHNMERMQAKLERAQSRLERAQSRMVVASTPVAVNAAWEIPSADELNRQIETSIKAAQSRLNAQAKQAQIAAQALANAQAAMANINAQNMNWSDIASQAMDSQAMDTQDMAGLAKAARVNTVEIQRQYKRTMQRMTNHTVPKISHPAHSTSAHL
jgi:hypothetical protein